jgi:hypothetical protein
MSHTAPRTDLDGAIKPRWYQAPWVTALRVVGAGLAICAGFGLVVVVTAVGHCSAFGGTCPREGGFPADVFRMAAFGGAVAVAVPYYLKQPTRRRLAASGAVGVVAGAAVGLFAVQATAG